MFKTCENIIYTRENSKQKTSSCTVTTAPTRFTQLSHQILKNNTLYLKIFPVIITIKKFNSYNNKISCIYTLSKRAHTKSQLE